jgi:hypothetical protein
MEKRREGGKTGGKKRCIELNSDPSHKKRKNFRVSECDLGGSSTHMLSLCNALDPMSSTDAHTHTHIHVTLFGNRTFVDIISLGGVILD